MKRGDFVGRHTAHLPQNIKNKKILIQFFLEDIAAAIGTLEKKHKTTIDSWEFVRLTAKATIKDYKIAETTFKGNKIKGKVDKVHKPECNIVIPVETVWDRLYDFFEKADFPIVGRIPEIRMKFSRGLLSKLPTITLRFAHDGVSLAEPGQSGMAHKYSCTLSITQKK